MNIKAFGFLFFILLAFGGVLGFDFYQYKDLDVKQDIQEYIGDGKLSLFGLVDIPRNIVKSKELSYNKFINKTDVDISIQQLQFYQDEYGKILNINCDQETKLKLQRNYIIEPTYLDKIDMLKSVNGKGEKSSVDSGKSVLDEGFLSEEEEINKNIKEKNKDKNKEDKESNKKQEKGKEDKKTKKTTEKGKKKNK